MKRSRVAIFALFVGMSLFGQSQETELEEVSIEGKFMSLSYKTLNENTVVITRRDIESSPAQSLDEILQQTLGLDVQRRGVSGVQSDVSIRGGSFEQTLILINGIRMNDAQTGHNSFNIPVDLENVERIEIVNGPAARRFGNNAFAGVVNVVTRISEKDHVRIKAELGDYSSYGLSASAALGTENFRHLLQTSTSASEGYRHNTDYKIQNVFYQNELRIPEGKLKFQAGFTERKFGANGFYASPLATEQYEETQASVVSIGLEKAVGKVQLKSNLFWRRGQDLYLYDRAMPQGYRNMHIGNTYGGEINVGVPSKLGYSGIGIELRQEDLASNNLGGRNRFLAQGFFEHHFSFFEEKLQIVPGITWANYSGVGSFFYPGLDLGYNLSSRHKLYANAARVHRIPTFTDLYYVSKTEIGNPDLSPENAFSYEFGYRYLHKGILAKASVFGRETKNGIDWIKNEPADPWVAQNVGNISTLGFEAELSVRPNRFVQSYSLGYTYLNQELDTKAELSKYVLDHQRHQLIGKLENRLTKHLTTEWVYRFQSRADGYSYHLLDAKLQYELSKVELFLLLQNLTNTQYHEAFGVPMPGRYFQIGASVRLDFK
ncbi:TonB-dependent receptor plug domain-containing protein [Chryseobacterium sp. A301]